MKKIRKVLPLSIYDISGIEHWLTEQAKDGLFPVAIRSWVTFTPTGKPGTRFRLAARENGRETPLLEQLEACREAGWAYAFSFLDTYFLFYTADPEAPELFPDYASRGISLELLNKRDAALRRRKWIPRIIYLLLFLLLVWMIFFYERKFDIQPDRFAQLPLALLSLFHPAFLTFLLCSFLIWRSERRDRKAFLRLRSALEQGLPIPSSPGPRKAAAWEMAAVILLGCVLVFFLVVEKFDVLRLWNSVPLERFHRPYTQLQVLEQETILPGEEFFEEYLPYDYRENFADVHRSLLALSWYSVTQKGYSTSEDTEVGEAYRYSPGLDMTYFQLLIPAMARPVAQAQLDAYRLTNLRWSYQELQIPGLDFAILATEPEGNWTMAAFGKDGRAVVYRYVGEAQLADHLELLSAVVQ